MAIDVATPSTPSPAPSSSSTPPRGRSVRRWVWASLLLLLLILGVCEALGWPFLAGPAERFLTQTLQREVLLRQADGQPGWHGARVRFLGGLKVQVPMLQIAAPPW